MSARRPGDAERDDLDVAFATGGETAVRSAYERYGSLVYTFCRRVVGAADAGDVAQEVFIAAWRGQRSYDPDRGGLGGWLMSIARNKSIDHLRRDGRRPVTTSDIDYGALKSMPDDEVDMVADRMLLAEALTGLDPRARQVIELAYLSDMTHEQVAERTGLPLGTVKSDIRRNIARLRHSLNRPHPGGVDA